MSSRSRAPVVSPFHCSALLFAVLSVFAVRANGWTATSSLDCVEATATAPQAALDPTPGVAEPASEESPGSRRARLADYGRLAILDLRKTVTAPGHWSTAEWRRAGLLVGGIGVTMLVDESVRDAVARNHSHALDEFTDALEPFGGGYSDRVLIGFLLTGLVTKDRKALDVAFDGYVGSYLASKLVTGTLKKATGRSRPWSGEGAYRFEPFDGERSMPSGHATQAFAVASVIAAHYEDRRWVVVAAYGTASVVAFARIYHDAHWASDVLAGAAIGTVIGRSVVHWNDEARAKWSVQPEVSADGRGILFGVRF